MKNCTQYKEMSKGTAFVIVQNESGHKRYINGSFNPEIGITYVPEGAKHYDTYPEAEKEMKELQLDNDGFIVEEHEWI